MRRVKAAILGLAGVLLVWAPAWPAEPPLGGAWISAVEGEAVMQFAEDSTWRPALLNTPLLPGDRLQVGSTGRIEVFFSTGSAIRLGPGSAARLVAVPAPGAGGDPPAEADLEAGRAIVTTGDGERSRPLVLLDVPGTRISVYARSRVRADSLAFDATDVALRGGAASADTLGSTIPLRIGETLQIGRGGATLVAGLPQDDFDRWADSLDRTLAAAPSGSSYLPAPLAFSTAGLESYGQWTTVPEYGSVWRPTAVVAGWAPFTRGRWLWRGGTWVWLPGEPWGWMPFHYGRWRWNPFLGWYWVPPRPRLIAWCPGAVAWILTPYYVTWLPLAPGDRFSVSRPPGPWSALGPTVGGIQITSATISKTFMNADAPSAMVAVPVNAFKTSTVVDAVAARTRLAALTPNQRLSVVTPANLAPDGSSRRTGTPAAAIPDPSVNSRTHSAAPPVPPSVQTSAGGISGRWPPARPDPDGAGQTLSRPRGLPSSSVGAPPVSVPNVRTPSPLPAGLGPRSAGDPQRQDFRAQGFVPQTRLPVAGSQVPIQPPVGRHGAPPVARPLPGSDLQRNGSPSPSSLGTGQPARSSRFLSPPSPAASALGR